MFQYIKGQEHAKRALEVATAGGHGVLLVGPPATGKSLLFRALSDISPGGISRYCHIEMSTSRSILADRPHPGGAPYFIEARPCPCGYYGVRVDRVEQCVCTAEERPETYRHRVIAPLAEAADILLTLPPLYERQRLSRRLGENPEAVRERVQRAHQAQRGADRYPNAGMTLEKMHDACCLDEGGESLLRSAIKRIPLDMRRQAAALKVARTIADLEGEESIRTPHFAEALQYQILST